MIDQKGGGGPRMDGPSGRVSFHNDGEAKQCGHPTCQSGLCVRLLSLQSEPLFFAAQARQPRPTNKSLSYYLPSLITKIPPLSISLPSRTCGSIITRPTPLPLSILYNKAKFFLNKL